MGIVVAPITAGAAHQALAETVAGLKAGEPLRPVTVVVPTNAAGVIARRQLGRLVGVAAVDMVTTYRLAERLAGPSLRAEQRLPVSTAVVDQAVRAVLRDHRTAFDAVRDHPSTTVALRDLHRELRIAGPSALVGLRSSPRGRDVLQVSELTSRRLSAGWYDEGDLLTRSIEVIREGHLPPALSNVVVFLPQWLGPLERELLAELGQRGSVHVVTGLTGHAHADQDVVAVLAGFGDIAALAVDRPPTRAEVEVVSVTDADEEVRHAVRAVVDAARAGTAFSRIAVLWPGDRPYARLVEHHLGVAGIRWNGRPGTRVAERVVPRFLTDLLDVDRRGLRRRDLFDLLADVGARDGAGHPLPVTSWERISRDAGVARGDDWTPRLRAYAAGRRSRAERLRAEAGDEPPDGSADHQLAVAADADALADYVLELRRELGHPTATRTWSEWAEWATDQVQRRLGRSAIEHDEPEYQAWEHTSLVLDRLRHLDSVADPPTRREFRSTFTAEFDVAPGRLGRIGAGVTVGSLASAVGLAAELVIVLGAAEGVLPRRPSADPLISDTDRRQAGLPTSDVAAAQAHRQFLGLLDAAARVVLLTPRGDLRSTADRQPSRWLGEIDIASETTLDSHTSALVGVSFPAHATEHRMRALTAAVLADDHGVLHRLGDPALQRSLGLRAARRNDDLTIFDGDLSGVVVPHLDRPIAPTRLEAWVACPLGYFMQYLLGVREIEEPSDNTRITPIDRGNLLHEVLDAFHQQVIAGELAQPGAVGWGDAHLSRIVELFEQVADRYERSGRTGRPASWAVERQRLLGELLEWLAADSRRSAALGAEVIASEVRFGGDGEIAVVTASGRRLGVTGMIDRLDRTPSGLVVTDHKTGRAQNYDKLGRDEPTATGTRFQLPAYAAAAARIAGVEPGELSITAEYSFFEAGRYRRIGYDLDPEVWARVGADLDHVVSGIEAGWFPARPAEPKYEHRPSCWYCQPDGLGAVERYREWERKRHDPRIARWFGEDPDGEDDP